MEARRFPSPWTVEDTNDTCFVVTDANGQALGYFYFEEDHRRRSAAKPLTIDEARRIAVKFVSLRRNLIGGKASLPEQRNARRWPIRTLSVPREQDVFDQTS